MWNFKISSGQLWNNDCFYGRGYSGAPGHVDNPSDEFLMDEGPLPEGLYTMCPPIDSEKLGPVAIRLVPDVHNEMRGRGGFFIHGDSIEFAGLEMASLGCIVTARIVREALAASIAGGDNQLQVTR